MVINPIVGVYIPIIGFPIKGWMTIPNTRSLDPGTNDGLDDGKCVKDTVDGKKHPAPPGMYKTLSEIG